MITIRLKGGLGNQMFQYAMARAVAEETGQDLALDTSWFLFQNKRRFRLNEFNIKGEVKSNPVKETLLRMPFLKEFIELGRSYYKEQTEFSFDESVFDVSGNVTFEGYWQNEKYFKDIRNILRKEFTLKDSLPKNGLEIKGKIKDSNSVSIHIRRGDYVKDAHINKIHGVCSLDYYQRTIALIKKEVESPHFFIFSDDIDWVKGNLSLDEDAVFVSQYDLKDTEELVLMSECKHNIIANSSFSWWAAWLNNYGRKLVIAPEKWFNNSKKDVAGLIPSSWKRI